MIGGTIIQRPESSKKKRSAIKYCASLLAVRNKNKEAQGQTLNLTRHFQAIHLSAWNS